MPVNLHSAIGSSTFTWYEVLYSKTAKKEDSNSGLSTTNPNSYLYKQYNPPQQVIDNMTALIENVIEPARQSSGVVFQVNSGYRHKNLNTLIGGSSSSQHIVGEAIDIQAVPKFNNAILFEWIKANVFFDQLIWENGTKDNPSWIHVSFKSTGTNDGQVFAINQGVVTAAPKSSVNALLASQTAGWQNATQTAEQQLTPYRTSNTDGEIQPVTENNEVPLEALFADFSLSLRNQEAGSTPGLKWGSKLDAAERSDWIGLKQFLIYLCTRFSPQGLVPFLELIPRYQLSPGNLASASRLDVNDVIEEMTKIAGQDPPREIRGRVEKALKYLKEPIPGYNEERYNNNAALFNKLTGKTDLFKLDPFQEEFTSLGILSTSGKATTKKKAVGVRLYGQIVLTPEAGVNEVNKAGAIGFESVEIKAGSTANNGLTLISMTIKDIQGNKFTDINSPWSFIFDSRPGSTQADFYFRYGWSLRVPNNNLDPVYNKFWGHPGWDLFGGERIKKQIQDVFQGDFRCLLTQSSMVKNIFDSDNLYNTEDITEDEVVSSDGYMQLSLINPQINVDTKGCITAVLQFRTSAQLARNTLLVNAPATQALCTEFNQFTLTDLIIAVNNDFEINNTLTIGDPLLKQSSSHASAVNKITANTDSLAKNNRDLKDLVQVVGGYDSGAGVGVGISPDRVSIVLEKAHVQRITDKNNQETLIAFLSDVLYANDCQLLAFHVGGGTTIGIPYVISTTQNVAMEGISQTPTTSASTLQEALTQDKDVMAFRHEGSLIEEISIQSTDAPNAYQIELNHQVSDLQSFDTVAYSSKDNSASILNRRINITRLFSQLLSCEVTSIGLPWLNPGMYFYVKGMGFNDGVYLCLESTHTFSEGNKFVTALSGVRVIFPPDITKAKQLKENICCEQTNVTEACQ